MKEAEFWTFIRDDGVKRAVRVTGQIDEEMALGYYQLPQEYGARWHVVDLRSGVSPPSRPYKTFKAARSAVNAHVARMTRVKTSFQHLDVCHEFGEAVDRAKANGEAEFFNGRQEVPHA